MRFIYIDESGDLGLKGSKHLVLAALAVDEPKPLDKIIKRTRRRFKKELRGASELKANKSSDEIRLYLLKQVNTLENAGVFFIVLEKRKLVSDYLKNNKHKLYNYVAGRLAGYLPPGGSEVHIRIDRSKGRQVLEQDFNDYFLSRLRQGTNSRITIKHSDSQNWAGLQIVDFLAWDCFQKFERGNGSFLELVQIQNEAYYVWQ